MSTDDYDDGLVHSHIWATEPVAPRNGGEASMAPHPADGATGLPAAISLRPEEHDDGLVHRHDWASSEHNHLARAS